MTMTLGEIKESEYRELQERRKKEREELQKELKNALNNEFIEVNSIREEEDSYRVDLAFTLDNFKQNDVFYWIESESMENFIKKVKHSIDYIKELRETYPDYCKQNDFIQTNREFRKEFPLTHMGYSRSFELNIKLADYLKLPNETDTGFGGGDYEIKRTPKRVEEYNRNIDITIDILLDCIAELKQKKYVD